MGGSQGAPMASGPCGHVYCHGCLVEAVKAQVGGSEAGRGLPLFSKLERAGCCQAACAAIRLRCPASPADRQPWQSRRAELLPLCCCCRRSAPRVARACRCDRSTKSLSTSREGKAARAPGITPASWPSDSPLYTPALRCLYNAAAFGIVCAPLPPLAWAHVIPPRHSTHRLSTTCAPRTPPLLLLVSNWPLLGLALLLEVCVTLGWPLKPTLRAAQKRGLQCRQDQLLTGPASCASSACAWRCTCRDSRAGGAAERGR